MSRRVQEFRVPLVEPLKCPLPKNLDAERSVLGAILLDNHALNTAVEKLAPRDFFLPQHSCIFRHMVELGETQCAIDLVTLAEELGRKGELEAAGGGAYLAQLVDGVPRVTHLEHYAGIVKDKALLRSLIHACDAIQKTAALDGEDDPRDLVERAFKVVGGLRSDFPRTSFVAPTVAELLAQVPPKPKYLVDGLVPEGMVLATLGKIKAGKTTFKLKLIEAMLTGEPFLGFPTTRATVLYVTEQSRESFLSQVQRAEMREEAARGIRLITHYDLIGLDWAARARLIGEQAAACQAGLVGVDTFSRVALVQDENDAAQMQSAVDVLLNFIPKGTTVDLAQHERKSGGDIEDAGRGTSALGGCADVLLRISRVGGPGQDRRRDLQTISRPWTAFEEPQRIELGEDNLYHVMGPAAGRSGRDLESKIAALWPGPHLSVREIVQRTYSTRSNVQRALDSLIRDGIVCATGEGKRGDPKRYRGVEP